MGDKTGIEWSDATWNPVTGCDRTSPGCDNCYALKQAARLKRMGQANYQNDGDQRTSGPGFGVTCHPHMLDQPLRWTRPRRIFVNSMSDLFHPAVPDEFIALVFDVMAGAPQHTFQVLTKRAPRMSSFVHRYVQGDFGRGWPKEFYGVLSNVWLGVSIESDRYTFRADHLRATPAAVRWISAEPLLGPLPSLDLTGIDWLVAGGESGPGARPMHPDWVRDLRDRCTQGLWVRGDDGELVDVRRVVADPTAFLFKQWGEWAPMRGTEPASLGSAGRYALMHYPTALARGVYMERVGKRAAGRVLDGRTWDEYPEVGG